MPDPRSCPTCAQPLPPRSRFCGSCGEPVSASSLLPTQNLPSGAAPQAAFRPSSRLRRDRLEARFLPGALLAGRYRIVGPLGKGGMGEVYRADDLKLGQPVALKFLPPEFDADPERLRRFLDEVRIARQVSHPNICRVYDAVEADGQHFLSMEYVDGEDLGSLLRRIGHLPKDKAVEIARQLCAGLAAAHEIGVLHRDLKPANIMIDGRGRARVTDFGLAALAEEIGGEEIRSGTPAYMAPEQLAGREVTVRSDLYSLGLVLYELFTGKPAFEAATPEERRRLQTETTPSSPSSLVEGFDPAVERVILRCLEPDPARRPSSALSIAAALPGGDPLAAALAAGETPSPQMVAEAGDSAVPPALSWSALALLLAALVGCIALAPRMSLVAMVPLEKPPAFLQERAREILSLAGHDGKPADSLFTFRPNVDYLRDLPRREGTGTRPWETLRATPPSGIHFWYRQSPKDLTLMAGASLGNEMEDPPSTAPGMARVELDPEGRLISLSVVPGERAEAPPAAAMEPDWDPLLRATGVDARTVQPVAPEWAPPFFADRRAAWTASWPGRPEVPLRLEAASTGGRPVFFRVVEPWTRPAEAPAPPEGLLQRASQLTNTIAFMVVIVAAALVALRNVRRGRGDRRGALRLALYLGSVRMVWYLGAHHVASPQELDTFIAHLSYAMQRVGLVYVMYLAVEPYARRLWPRMLVSWVRVLDGRLRDPLVGRDLLVGCAAASLGVLLSRLCAWTVLALGGSSDLSPTNLWNFEALQGPLKAVVALVGIHTAQLLDVMIPVTLLVIFRLLLRRSDLALLALSLVGVVIVYPGSGSIPAYLLGFVLVASIAWIALLRFGLLAFATMTTVSSWIEQMPLTTHPEGWYLGAMLLALVVIVAPALWGFWTAQGGRPLFRDTLLEPAARR